MFLNCHTHYSFGYGTLSVTQLLEQAAHFRIKRLVISDINNTSAILQAMREAPKFGVQIIPGIDIRQNHMPYYIGIAQSPTGLENLNLFLSQHLHSQKPFPKRAPLLPDVFFVYPFAQCPQIFEPHPHEWVGIGIHQLNKLRFSPWLKYRNRLVVHQPVTLGTRKDFNAHRLLQAMQQNTLLSKLDATWQARPDAFLIPENSLLKTLEPWPFLIGNTRRLLDQCYVSLPFGTPKNKAIFGQSTISDAEQLRQLAHQGLYMRYTNVSKKLADRLQYELEIIEQKGYIAYFLIAHDIIKFAEAKHFFHVGRGSGANSLVAYCLRITDVDPIDLDLYFERFINLYRENPPDFDLDFSWKDRDTILNYIFEKYGQTHTALLATYNTFQPNSIIRELGKVFGLPTTEIETLIDTFGKADAVSQLGRLTHIYAQYMLNWPNHLSIHAGGIVIAEKPIYCYTATWLPPKGMPTTQFDMVIAEDIGLYKFDILSQRGLGHIRDAVQLIANKGIEIDIHRIQDFKNDANIKNMLRKGETTGCFYVESPAMRNLLTKLRTDTYLGLVAASSIIRPGVARSGMMRAYIERHRQPELCANINPIMAQILPDTYGIMVYQEDVIKVAHHFAGLSLAESDVLRRGMSGKFRSREEFQRVKDRYFELCKARNYTNELAAEVWFQIESFAGYSFAKGHSASFAVESYQSLFLKAYYPLQFITAVINNFGGFYRTEIYVHEARKAGATIEAPCINNSIALCKLQDNVIWLGFSLVKGLFAETINQILFQRKNHGPFTSLVNCVERLKIGIEQWHLLIQVGALRFTQCSRASLLWQINYLHHKSQKTEDTQQTKMFLLETHHPVPSLPENELLYQLDLQLLLGFTLCSPFAMLQQKPTINTLATAFPTLLHRKCSILGYLVTLKPTRTAKGERMYFGTFLDLAGNWLDTVHFPPIVTKYPVTGPGVYLLSGRVTSDFDCYVLEIESLKRLPYVHRENLCSDMEQQLADNWAWNDNKAGSINNRLVG